MRVPVASVTEFAEQVSAAYLELMRTPEDAVAALEIELAPGEYRDANWSIGDREQPGRIGIVVRSAQLDQPAILHNTRLTVAAERVDLSGLVFRRHADRAGGLSIVAGRALSIEHCTFVQNQVVKPSAGPLVELVSAAPAPEGAEALLRQCYFVDNWVADEESVVGCTPEPPHFFSRVRLEEVAFIGNQAAACVVPHTTASVETSNCLVVFPEERSDAEFVARTSAGMRVVNEATVVTVQNVLLRSLLQQWRAEAAEGRVLPIEHVRSALLASS